MDFCTAKPEIFEKELDENIDFVFLGSDGIFDVLSNKKIVEIVWMTIKYYRNKSVNQKYVLEEAMNNVMRKAMILSSEDNVSGILIFFKNLYL